jgi:hypothetical protein
VQVIVDPSKIVRLIDRTAGRLTPWYGIVDFM